MRNNIKLIGLALVTILVTSCSKDLDTKPRVELSFENLLQQDPNAAKGLLSKLYGTFALSGSNGPGSTDISAADAGESAFLRSILNLEDFSADGLKNRWGDNGLDQLTTATNWNGDNKFFANLFNRIYYTVPQSTNLIKALGSVNDPNKAVYISELRFLRSLAYYYLIDCFGKGPLVTTENYGTTTALPESSRTQLFAYVESELLAIENDLPATNDYGRANKSCARMLLAKLYLNAEVYTGTAKYTEALTYVNKIVNPNNIYLASNYKQNFTADNYLSLEIIFSLIADAQTHQSYGNTTYLVSGSLSSDTMYPIEQFGATAGWGGHRATKAWYGLFATSAAGLAASADVRASLFWTTGQTYEMTDYKVWTNGYPSIKYNNLNANGSGTPTNFSNTDFPLFRYADLYLMYAECVLRGASGGNITDALTYVNAVRNRSNATSITQSNLTLDFILDERARELNFEGHRRTDLIRFGKFTGGTYLWPWKGNVLNGTSIPDTYKLFPIPAQALVANPNLTQNPGY